MTDSTIKHTPGSWEAEGTFVRTLRGAELDGFLVAEYPTDSINYAANVAFIAAAPETAAERDRLKKINVELIEALKELHVALRQLKNMAIIWPTKTQSKQPATLSPKPTP